jgi:hypothetical protein
VQARVVALNKEDAVATIEMEGTISISNTEARVLIDLGSTHFFIATSFTHALEIDDKSIPCNIVVSTPLGKWLGSDVCYKDCKIILGGVVLTGDLVRLPIEDFDAILAID